MPRPRPGVTHRLPGSHVRLPGTRRACRGRHWEVRPEAMPLHGVTRRVTRQSLSVTRHPACFSPGGDANVTSWCYLACHARLPGSHVRSRQASEARPEAMPLHGVTRHVTRQSRSVTRHSACLSRQALEGETRSCHFMVTRRVTRQSRSITRQGVGGAATQHITLGYPALGVLVAAGVGGAATSRHDARRYFQGVARYGLHGYRLHSYPGNFSTE